VISRVTACGTFPTDGTVVCEGLGVANIEGFTVDTPAESAVERRLKSAIPDLGRSSLPASARVSVVVSVMVVSCDSIR
jgi:hypothetical protein